MSIPEVAMISQDFGFFPKNPRTIVGTTTSSSKIPK
jgi:hypothetical protein